jgi:exoribonuclease-2
MSLEGRIIEFLDADNLRIGYVRKQEHEKLHLVDTRGRNLSVSGDRVVVVHRPANESDFPAMAKHISENVLRRRSEVDVELLWHSLEKKEAPLQPAELGKLFFSEDSPEAASAVFHALFEDALFFRRKGIHFIPKSGDQVEAETLRRQREREHEEFRQRATSLITTMVRKKDGPIPDDAKPVIDRIQSWLRLRNGDEVGTLLEQIAGPTKARDIAYELLRRAGRIDAAVDRFLVVAGVEEKFAPALIEAAQHLTPYSHHGSRVDYREHAAFTIDDEDTREVDDALTLYRDGDEIVVGIHIADLSPYVTKDDALDLEARRRSSTIYLPSTTVRMFPEHLSTNLVSLNAAKDRPAYTVEVRFDTEGVRRGYRIVLSTLRVARRLSYEEADAGIAAGDETLRMLCKFALELQRLRAERGAITFRRPELKIRVDDDDIAVKKINPNSESRTLVSEMMILANSLSADFASVNALPVIFRTQEPREAVAIDETPVVEALAFERLRKTFKRSRLSLTPGAHSGLGLTAYTQASSPIRRYADLVTQRQFTAMLSGEPVPHGREELLHILAAAEAAEVEIRQLEERSTQYWLFQYLARHKMQEALAAVFVDNKGHVELEDFYVRAKVMGMKGQPGERVMVRIESLDPVKGELRLAAS